VSKGNAERPTAQAPPGHSSPNHVEVTGDGRQGVPQSPGTPRPQSPDTPGPRDQSRGEGPGPRAHEPERAEQRLPWGAASDRTCGRRRSHWSGWGEQEPAVPRECHPPAAERRASGWGAEPWVDPAEAAADAIGPAEATAAGSATTATAGRRPSCERFRAYAASYSISTHPRASPGTAGPWRRTRMGSAPTSCAQAIRLGASGVW